MWIRIPLDCACGSMANYLFRERQVLPMIVDWMEPIHELIAFGMTLSIRSDTQRALIPQCSPPGQRGKGTTLCWRGNWQQPLVGNGSSCSPLICGWAVLEDAFWANCWSIMVRTSMVFQVAQLQESCGWHGKSRLPTKSASSQLFGKKQSPSLVNWSVFCSCWLASWGDFCPSYCAKWQLRRSGAHAPTTRWGRRGDRVGDPSSGSVQFGEPI